MENMQKMKAAYFLFKNSSAWLHTYACKMTKLGQFQQLEKPYIEMA